MCWALPPLLLLLLSPALLANQADPLQERVPFLRLTQAGSGGPTASPCAGLPQASPASVSLVNRSLERLPGCLPRALRSLDGSHNLLSVLSMRELGALPQLQVLTLSHNRIAELRWGSGGPEGLHTLDLSHNRLAALPRCDSGPALSRLHKLHLAGNPLRTLGSRAFSCFPALRFLNLSSTALGRDTEEPIAPAAFTDRDSRALGALETLDLSGTFLTRVQSEWILNLPNLTAFYLRNMPRLKQLDDGVFKLTPNLQQLDCQDSRALAVHTHVFEDTPRLRALSLQNCNLSSFPPWTLNSSQVLSVNLFGNPLICSCELSWLLSDAKRIVLNRAGDTMCAPDADSSLVFPAPLSLAQLPDMCQSIQTDTFVTSTQPSQNVTSPGIQPTSTNTVPSSHSRAGRQSVTKAPSLDRNHTTPASEPHSSALERAAHSTAGSSAGHNCSSLPRTAGPELRAQDAAPLVTSVAPKTFIRSYPVSPSEPSLGTAEAPQPSPSTGGIPIILLDDYSEEEGEEAQAARTHPQDAECDYHPCRHLQIPCAELQRRRRCRCPGLSGEDTVPDPPSLQAVSEVTDTSAIVHWCGPNSVVHEYQIRYYPEGQAGAPALLGPVHAIARQLRLSELAPATTYRVCVLAANRAGQSALRGNEWRRPCAAFTTRPSPALLLTALGAGCGVLLLSTLVLAVCLCLRARQPPEGQHPTHLVAYKNPTFDCPPRTVN
ncbi:PREDICTED: leucine-rich repeat neuronal protein 4 [Elephantulus edwardii]|uniref:leucine-rich repeat neuronal protein 4 n=1 Tax=Elephantulus edwardii TaxID=28737 RepID=UPI0003F0C375|nr:PREDICTED: leucine-rich repeat neuronal protein 4 [Elephantulus edwardii]